MKFATKSPVMINHVIVFISFSAVQVYDLSYSFAYFSFIFQGTCHLFGTSASGVLEI